MKQKTSYYFWKKKIVSSLFFKISQNKELQRKIPKKIDLKKNLILLFLLKCNTNIKNKKH